MRPLISVDIHGRGVLIARAELDPNRVPTLALADGTDDDLRVIRAEACGAENVRMLSGDAFLRRLLDAFPAGLASAFGAFTATPRYGS